MEKALGAAENVSWKYQCTLVVPCYNEAARLKTDRFLQYIKHTETIKFLFVNDGSRDETLRVLEAMQAEGGSRIEVLNKVKNGGKGEAVRDGMLHAMHAGDSEFVGFWDADLATPLDEIPRFLRTFQRDERLQMVFGSRVRLLGRAVHRKATRHYLGRVFASVVSIVLRLPIYDTQCGAKIFRVTPELAQILSQPFLSRWVFDVEILARYIAMHKGEVQYLHDSIYELPLSAWEDIAGSKVGPKDFISAFMDICRIYLRYLA